MRTAEATVTAFLTGWRRRDWKAMNRAVQVRRVKTSRSTPRRLEALFGDKQLSAFEILGAPRSVSEARVVVVQGKRHGITPEAVEVRARVTYRIGGVLRRRVIALNVIREDDEGLPPAEATEGRWGVNETSALRESVDSADGGDEVGHDATG